VGGSQEEKKGPTTEREEFERARVFSWISSTS
jgi:hypothetical protein